MQNNILKYTSIFLVAIVIAVAIHKSSTWYSKLNIGHVAITVTENEGKFISEEKIIKELLSSHDELIGAPISSLNILEIEKHVESLEAIKKADVFIGLDTDNNNRETKLIIKITQREAIVRVLDKYSDYYIDEEGIKIEHSEDYTPLVPLVRFKTKINNDFLTNNLLPMLTFISNEKFANSLVDQIIIDQNKNIKIIPRVGKHVIEFGNVGGYKEKLENLKAFYAQELKYGGLERYSLISLKYDNQIVCTKN